MPNSTEHRAKYDLNRTFLNTGLATANPPWAAVVAFYAAVHLIERLAAAEQRGPIHHRTHTQRRLYLSKHRQHDVLADPYEALQDAAETSRYGTVAQFNARYAATVQSVLIDTHLVAIEDYVAAFFAPPSPPAAPPVATGS